MEKAFLLNKGLEISSSKIEIQETKFAQELKKSNKQSQFSSELRMTD